MGKEVTIGGNRLGAGKRMMTNLKSYERSTHNLGYLWRSTMAPGTLVPFLVEPALPGDTWDIGLASEALTLPTVGPLFGSFKLQLDVFSVPIRLYQAQLHNNKLYIGMKMEDIKLPLMEVKTGQLDFDDDEPVDLQQINPSSLLAYLGVRGNGRNKSDYTGPITREYDACPLLAYWDIYKNYYANKQEEVGMYLHTDVAGIAISYIDVNGSGGYTVDTEDVISTPQTVTTGKVFTHGFVDNLISGQKLDMYIDGEWVPINWVGAVTTGAKTITVTASSAYNGLAYTKVRSWDPAQKEQEIQTFDLSNLDDMREDILEAIKTVTAFKVTEDTANPYGDILKFGFNNRASAYYNQDGLALKTYQSDIFNNWLSTEWIDGVNGINAITSVDTSEGKFSLDTLNLAKKIYSLLNDISMSGGSYEDWIEASWDIDAMRKAESPIYEGGLSREVVFNEVISNSASDTTLDGNIEPLGTLGGRGVMSDKNKGGKCVIKVQEPSYIIGIVSLTPRLEYSQGNRWYTNLKTMNDFHKPALDQIGFQDLVTDQMAVWDTEVGDDGIPEFSSAGKQPAWINYQTNFNRTYGNFADENKEMFMTLNRRYEPDTDGSIKDLTTYIDPSKFNYAFASTKLDSQNFWVHIGVDAEVRRKMSAKIMPNP